MANYDSLIAHDFTVVNLSLTDYLMRMFKSWFDHCQLSCSDMKGTIWKPTMVDHEGHLNLMVSHGFTLFLTMVHVPNMIDHS